MGRYYPWLTDKDEGCIEVGSYQVGGPGWTQDDYWCSLCMNTTLARKKEDRVEI